MAQVELASAMLILTLTSLLLAVVFLLCSNRYFNPAPGKISKSQPLRIAMHLDQKMEVSKMTNAPDNWFTAEDVFEVERRAIFSQVSIVNVMDHHGVDGIDLVMHHALQPLQETRRLPLFQGCRVSVLPHPGKRQHYSRIP